MKLYLDKFHKEFAEMVRKRKERKVAMYRELWGCTTVSIDDVSKSFTGLSGDIIVGDDLNESG